MKDKTRGAREGMTLVELLVALVVLASLAVSVAVASSASLDRERTDRTIRQGEAMRDALESAEGLSISSDMGPLFDTATADDAERNARNLARLGYLFSPSNVFTVAVEEDGTVTESEIFKEAPLFAVRESPLLPANFASLAGLDATRAARLAATTNGLGSVSLGCGWRGPYCRERVRDDDGVLRDGFGGPWECSASPTNCTLTSRGADRTADSAAEPASWQDRDVAFEVRAGDALATLTVSLDESAMAAGVSISNLYVFAYAPRFDVPDGAATEGTVSIAATVLATTNSPFAYLKGLSVGERMFFAVGEDQAGNFHAARPQRMVIHPGVNELRNLRIAAIGTSE